MNTEAENNTDQPNASQQVEVTARKNQDGLPIGGRKFQLLSAGADNVFGTEDDISFPEQ